jgi:flotillin
MVEDFVSGIILITIIILFIVLVRKILSLRRIVLPNEVHIVRKGSKTLVYGKAAEQEHSSGNSYYEFPVWLPIIGLRVQRLPLSNFDIKLETYEAYDKDKLPFILDIKAFFHINDYRKAAERIDNNDELYSQLKSIVQGASRQVLANDALETIMVERSKYGKMFTDAVQDQLKEWGVTTVKDIELMDISDAKGQTVIANIMNKKKSDIEKESRIMVARNMREAQEAEIEAKRSVDIKQQDAEEKVGIRKAEVTKNVGISEEQSQQAVKEQAKITAEKDMEVKRVKEVQAADIEKQTTVIKAEAHKKQVEIDAEAMKNKAVIDAEAHYALTTKEAEANLVKASKSAEGIKAEGEAKAGAEKQMQLATVEPQITLAKEIGENQGYQSYLIEIRKVEANQEVGIKQAENLGRAEIKIISNADSVAGGVNKVMDVFTPKGGYNIATMLETFASTEKGQEIVEGLIGMLKSKSKKQKHE